MSRFLASFIFWDLEGHYLRVSAVCEIKTVRKKYVDSVLKVDHIIIFIVFGVIFDTQYVQSFHCCEGSHHAVMWWGFRLGALFVNLGDYKDTTGLETNSKTF